jgi:hypothetical protein
MEYFQYNQNILFEFEIFFPANDAPLYIEYSLKFDQSIHLVKL